MGVTVFTQDMGFFHKGSGGKGVAPLDVCLSPPPPPAGPVPIPYVNVAKAGDLSKGSKTVSIDGEPTALEDQSYVSTSSGDEAGTQGGSVITHKTKGKGYFLVWSATVLVEGKGVCRHGDMMGHNSASAPAGCVNYGVYADFCANPDNKLGEPCKESYVRPPRPNPTEEQRCSVQNGPCWQCGNKETRRYVADHQPPLKIAWELGACHWEKSPDAFHEWSKKKSIVAPHCWSCSRSQGGRTRRLKYADIVYRMEVPQRIRRRLERIDRRLHSGNLSDKMRDKILARRQQLLSTASKPL